MHEDWDKLAVRLTQRISDLDAQARIEEQPFTSDVPVLGRLITFIRKTWNSVATKWYVRPMLRQQNAFNQAVVLTIREVLQTQHDLDEYWYERFTALERRIAADQQRMDQHIATSEQRITAHDQCIVANDRDTTLVARAHAESEHRLRQLKKQTEEQKKALTQRLSCLEEMLEALETMDAGQGGESQ